MVASGTGSDLGNAYVTWRGFHSVVWPAVVSAVVASVSVSWGLSRASTADMQESINRVLAIQNILLQKAVSGGNTTQNQRVGVVLPDDEFQPATISTDEFADLMGCNADTVRRRQKSGDPEYQDFVLVGTRMRWTNPRARIEP